LVGVPNADRRTATVQLPGVPLPAAAGDERTAARVHAPMRMSMSYRMATYL
jgi:hypothetical protein